MMNYKLCAKKGNGRNPKRVAPKIKKHWHTPFGVVETPNLFYKESNKVLTYTKLGYDLDHNVEVNKLPYLDIHVNPQNNHKHIFINIRPMVSYNGLAHLIKECSNKTESTTASILLDRNEVVFSWIADSFFKTVFNKLAKVVNADPATSSHINHPFRRPNTWYKDFKCYKEVHKATQRITLFDVAKFVKLDKADLVRTVYSLFDEITERGILHPTIMNGASYNRKQRKIKKTEIALDYVMKFVAKNYWNHGIRQKLAMCFTGIIYKYFTKNEKEMESIMDSILPQNDEERYKRLHPIKYISKRKTFFALNKLIEIIKSQDKNFDIMKFAKETVDIKEDSDIIPFKKRQERKHLSEFELAQVVLLIIVALIFNKDENHIYDIDDTSITLFFKSRKQLMEYVNRYFTNHTSQSYGNIDKVLNLLRDKQIISLRKSGYKLYITIDIQTYNTLLKMVKYDRTRNQFIIWHLYGYLYANEENESLSDYYKAIEDTVPNFTILHKIIWNTMYIEIKDVTQEQIHKFLDLMKDAFNNYYFNNDFEIKNRFHKDVFSDSITYVDVLETFVISAYQKEFTEMYDALNFLDRYKTVVTFSNRQKQQLLNKLLFESTKGVSEMLDYLTSVLE